MPSDAVLRTARTTDEPGGTEVKPAVLKKKKKKKTFIYFENTSKRHWKQNIPFFETCFAPVRIQRDARAEPRVGLHVKCLVLLPDFNQNWNVWNSYNTKFHKPPFSGSRVITGGRTATHNERKGTNCPTV
jgi:hypothetical protein